MTDDLPPARQGDKIRCDACPVMCYIAPGQTGACDRYGNEAGRIVRTDPVVLLSKTVEAGGRLVPFAQREDWEGNPFPDAVVTGSAPERPTPTSSPRPSSCRRRSKASTWSPW